MILNKEEKRFYNYAYLDPTKPCEYIVKGIDIIFKFEPFYIGKGTGKRLYQHKYTQRGKFMKSKMKSLKEKNIDPIIVKIISNINNYESCENEKYLIKLIGRRDLGLGPLCNLTNGGEEGCGRIHTEREKELKRQRFKNIPLSEEHKRKIGLSNKIAQLTRKQVYKNPIIQYDLNGNFIREWKAISIAEKELKISNISRAIKFGLTAGKFKWEHKLKNNKND